MGLPRPKVRASWRGCRDEICAGSAFRVPNICLHSLGLVASWTTVGGIFLVYFDFIQSPDLANF